MVMNSVLIELTSMLRHLDIPDELVRWLMAEYGWDPYEDMYEPSELMDIIEDSYKQYMEGSLDVSVPDEAKLWKERAELARYMLKGITLEKDACVAENIRLSKLLDDNGIKY